ncbi:MAG TPA: hypothetical protein VGM49_03155 [Candidatus Limnocylindrales bacterium]|jgi:hypothetical protein
MIWSNTAFGIYMGDAMAQQPEAARDRDVMHADRDVIHADTQCAPATDERARLRPTVESPARNGRSMDRHPARG